MTLEVPISIFNQMIVSALRLIPNAIAAAILLLVGWIIGKVTGDATGRILKKLRLDEYIKAGKGLEISSIFSLIVSWVIYLTFIQAGLQVLGVTALSAFFGGIVALVTRLLGGMVIIVVGYILASYVQKQILASKTLYSKVVGQVIFVFALIISVEIALKFVDIPTQLIDNIILIIVGSIGVGVAIALGLGLKDTVAKLSKKHLNKL